MFNTTGPPVEFQTDPNYPNTTNPGFPLHLNNDNYLAAYDANGTFIDAQTYHISSPIYDDFSGGLVAFPSVYLTNSPYYKGGNVTEIIVTGQGGEYEPYQGFLGQRWILDNSIPKTLKYITVIDLISPWPLGTPWICGSCARFGLSVDCLPVGNSEYLIVFAGLVRAAGTASRQFIASFNEPASWPIDPYGADNLYDYYDYMGIYQNQSSYNVASNVAVNKVTGDIKISGVQNEQGLQQHPYFFNPINVGGTTTNGYLFIDNYRFGSGAYGPEIGPITGSLFSDYTNVNGAVQSDLSPEIYDMGYGALCVDNNNYYSQTYFSGNLGGDMQFIPQAYWNTVSSTSVLGPFFIARALDGFQGEVEFKNAPNGSSLPLNSMDGNVFSLMPNPAIDNTYLYSKTPNSVINSIEIYETSGKLL